MTSLCGSLRHGRAPVWNTCAAACQRSRTGRCGSHAAAPARSSRCCMLRSRSGVAVIFSVFGLQQLPDPAVAVARWVIDRKSAVNVTQTRRARSRMPARRRWRRSACMYVCMCVRMYACMYVYTYTPSSQRVRATGCVLTGRAFPPRRCDAWSAAAC